MFTMRSIATLALALPSVLAQELESFNSTKRGLAYVETSESADDHYWINGDLTWYYNWSPFPNSTFDDTGLQFVPMLFGNTDGNSQSFYTQVQNLIDEGRNITWVLGFNEPDGCEGIYGGSCLDATVAAQIWIREMEPLRELGIQLGGPAVTSQEYGFTWLQNFFTACDGQCNVDFLPIHYYGDFQGLASHTGRVNATYQNISSMWCTEFAYADEDLETTQSFYNESIAFFDRVPYMDKYSYFGAFRSSVSNVGPAATLLTEDGDLTDIGAYYLNMPEEAVGNVPEGGAPRVAGFAGSIVLVITAALWCMG